MTTARAYANQNPRGGTHPSAAMLNTTISTERLTSTVADSGGVSKSYATNLTGIPASVQPGTSTEAVRIGAERDTQTYDVYVEFGHEILTTDRIVYGSLKLDIAGKRDMSGRARVLHFIATETKGVAS